MVRERYKANTTMAAMVIVIAGEQTYSSQSQVVKDLCAVLPSICAGVLLLALIIEAVDLSDLARFVVTTQQCDLLGVAADGKDTRRVRTRYSTISSTATYT
jgi:hypothetical protein